MVRLVVCGQLRTGGIALYKARKDSELQLLISVHLGKIKFRGNGLLWLVHRLPYLD